MQKQFNFEQEYAFDHDRLDQNLTKGKTITKTAIEISRKTALKPHN